MKNLKIGLTEMKQLVQVQQEELDTVLVFRKLAECLNDDQIRNLLFRVADDEEKHADVLKRITGKKLTPGVSKKIIAMFLFRFGGMSSVLKVLAKDEFKTAASVRSFSEKYPELKELAGENLKHSRQLNSLVP